MKKKIIGILVCTLFILILSLPAAGVTNYEVQHNIDGGYTTTGWVEQAKLLASDGTAWDWFGDSVSIDGAYAIVGAYHDNGFTGSAYVFERNGTNWIQQAKLTASDGAKNDCFGVSVSIDGDYIIIGADGDNEHSGSAYIFKRNDKTWSEEQKLIASDGAKWDRFGFSVSIDGDYAIVGAHFDDDKGDDSGSAYIFKRNDKTWSEEQKLIASDGTEGDWFGFSVSIDGDYAIIGACCFDSCSTYVFKRNGTTWSEEQKLIVSGGDTFGASVSIDGNYTIIGDYHGNDYNGAAYVFKRNGTNWTQQAKLIASDGGRFGASVSIDENYAVIGADFDDDNGFASGSAYIFKRNGTNWTQQAKLIASDGAKLDYFGNSVSIDGEYVIIGAPFDDDNGENSGSAYIFKRNPPPNAPVITGRTSGKVGVEYQYNFSLFDPDDAMYLRVDWGNGTPGPWQGPYDSGTTVRLNHTWDKQGNFTIRAQAKDIYGAESPWGTLTVTMPINQQTSQQSTSPLFLQITGRGLDRR